MLQSSCAIRTAFHGQFRRALVRPSAAVGSVFLLVLVVLSVEPVLAGTLHIHDRVFGKSVFDKFAPEFERITGYELQFHALEFPVSEDAEQSLIYGEAIDMVAMYPSIVARLADAGWLEIIDDEPGLAIFEERLYPNAARAIRRNGELYGGSQFTAGLVVPLADLDRLEQLGLAQEVLPSNWPELNQRMIELAEAGHKAIYFPFWFDEGIGLSVAFIAEVWNRGGAVVDPLSFMATMQPDNGPAFDTLTDWRRLMQSGAVDKRVLDMNYAESLRAFATGDHAYSAYTVDGLLRAKGTGRRMTVLPRIDQDWGVMGSVAYGLVSTDNESEQRRLAKRKLLQLYTRGLPGNEFAVSRRLLSTVGYFSSYKDYMQSAEAQAIIRTKLNDPAELAVLMDVYENMDYPVAEWGAEWDVELTVFLRAQLRKYLLDDEVSAAEFIGSVNQKIGELRSAYGY